MIIMKHANIEKAEAFIFVVLVASKGIVWKDIKVYPNQEKLCQLVAV